MDENSSADWRSDLLQAVGYVFTKEREGLLAELRAQLAARGENPENSEEIINEIENHIRRLVSHVTGLRNMGYDQNLTVKFLNTL